MPPKQLVILRRKKPGKISQEQNDAYQLENIAVAAIANGWNAAALHACYGGCRIPANFSGETGDIEWDKTTYKFIHPTTRETIANLSPTEWEDRVAAAFGIVLPTRDTRPADDMEVD